MAASKKLRLPATFGAGRQTGPNQVRWNSRSKPICVRCFGSTRRKSWIGVPHGFARRRRCVACGTTAPHTTEPNSFVWLKAPSNALRGCTLEPVPLSIPRRLTPGKRCSSSTAVHGTTREAKASPPERLSSPRLLAESARFAGQLVSRNPISFLRGWAACGFDQLLHRSSHHEQQVRLPLFRILDDGLLLRFPRVWSRLRFVEVVESLQAS